MSVDEYIGKALIKYQTLPQMKQGIEGAAGKCGYIFEYEIEDDMTTLRVLRPGGKRFFRERNPDTPVVDMTYNDSITSLQGAEIKINVHEDELARKLLVKLRN